MVSVYRTDCLGARKDFVASFNTEEEAQRFVATHPEDFIGLVPVIK